AARSAYLFIRESNSGEDTGRTLMLPIKSNLGPRKEGLAFRIRQRLLPGDIIAPYVDWDDAPVAVTADQALASDAIAISGNDDRHDALDEAKEFLREELSQGEVEVNVIEAQAKKAGIAHRTLRRARRELKDEIGLKTRRDGFGPGAKFWLSLPTNPGPHRG